MALFTFTCTIPYTHARVNPWSACLRHQLSVWSACMAYSFFNGAKNIHRKISDPLKNLTKLWNLGIMQIRLSEKALQSVVVKDHTHARTLGVCVWLCVAMGAAGACKACNWLLIEIINNARRLCLSLPLNVLQRPSLAPIYYSHHFLSRSVLVMCQPPIPRVLIHDFRGIR